MKYFLKYEKIKYNTYGIVDSTAILQSEIANILNDGVESLIIGCDKCGSQKR